VRADQKSFKFINRKSKSQFLQRLNPRKIAWTQLYRRMHKKGTMEESTRKKTRKVSKTTNKAVVGMTLDVIKAKRSQKPEVRAAAREAALREIKERNKAKQAAKKAEQKTKAPPQKQQMPKSKASKASGKPKGVRR